MTNTNLDMARAMGWLARDISRDPTKREGPLAGLRFAAKDIFSIAGEVTRAGSALFDDDAPATADAGLVARARALGARLVCTANMDALAYGFVTDNPHYGLARNPHDDARICGGSSGGSAAMVAAGLVDFALGTDTSGSIRIPAAFCGVYGYKPSRGMLSDDGVLRLSPTFDRPGLFAATGQSLRDITRELATPRANITKARAVNNAGILAGYFTQGMSPEIAQAVDAFAFGLGAHAKVGLEGTEAARAAAYILVAHEAAQVHREKLIHQPDRFDPETRHRLCAAAAIDPSWSDSATRTHRDYAQRFARLFEEFDLLIAPCVPTLAPKAHELRQTAHPERPPLRANLGIYTQPITLTELPVVSIPLRTNGGLPTAVQVIGPLGSDFMLLDFAAAFEASGAIGGGHHV